MDAKFKHHQDGKVKRDFANGEHYCGELIDDKIIKELIEKEMMKKDFGNARGVRDICDRVISRQISRINKLDISSTSNETIVTINNEDLAI